MLFAKDPEKYIPSVYIRYIRYNGTTAQAGVELNISKDESIRGNILNQVLQTRTFIKTVLKDYYFLDMTEGRFLKLQEYPEEAWLE